MKKKSEIMEDQIFEEQATETTSGKSKTKKKSKKKTIIIIIVVAVLLFLVAVGILIRNVSKSMQEAMKNMASESDSTYKVEKQDVEQEITTSGTVIGLEKKAYVSPITAKVEDICVEVGQTVKKGDVLLTYDSSELGDSLEKVKIQAQSERAMGNESFEMASEAASKTSTAKKKVKNLKEDIKTIKKKVESLSNKTADYEEKIQAGEEIDEAAYKKVAAELEKKNKSLVSKQAKLAEQESIVAANKDVKVSESTKAQVSATNQLSNMNINDAEESLNTAEAGITASVSGIVESIDVLKGAYANETQTVMTIIDSDQVGIEFTISKDDLGSISEGQKARVVISGNEYEGSVDFVSRVASNDAAMMNTGSTSTGGTIKGRIAINNPDENIYIGVAAKVYIFVGKSEKALAVPYEALNTDIDGDFVYVVNKENLIERKDITVGLYSDEYYEVLDGLSEGDTVITEVTADMKPGDVYVGTAVAGTAVAE